MKLVVVLACYILLGFGCYAAVEKAFSHPVVYWSKTEERCIEVERDGQLGPCNPMPEKYYLKIVD